jgi:hypothetical protein
MMETDMQGSKPFTCVNNQYPRIGSALTLFWGERELVPYVEKLLLDTRNQSRQGFPSDIVAALHSLLAMHHVAFPGLEPPGENVWVANNKVR